MIEVRQAVAGDLDDVVALEARTFSDAAWSPRSIESEFDQVGLTRSIAVATEFDRVVGYAVLMYAGDTADLPRVAVGGGHRRQGVASALVAFLVGRARALGCDVVLLEVADANVAARALYGSQGFAPIDVRRRYYADGSDAIVMRRELNGSADDG